MYSPYVFVANNPLILVDPDGEDWFFYSKDGHSDPEWQWQEGSEYHTGVKDDDGNEVVLQGTQAVVVFDGSRSEQLGTKDGKAGFVDGKDAVTAKVTVYGPNGPDDIHHFTGYTMSSNPEKYGVVAEGIYDGNFDEIGKSGRLKSNWTLNNRGNVPDVRGRDPLTGKSDLDGIFIHSSNRNGFAGEITSTKAISEGCLLIIPADWKHFNDALEGVKNFKIQIIRVGPALVPLQGIHGEIPGKYVMGKQKYTGL